MYPVISRKTVFMLVTACFILAYGLPAQAQYYNEVKVTAHDSAAYKHFGGSVAVRGDLAIVGVEGDDENGLYSGAAYIFQQNAAQDKWQEMKKVIASDGTTNDSFGRHVDIDGDYAIVGAMYDDQYGFRSGSAYIFARNQGGPDNWGQVKKLVPRDVDANDCFGYVAISGDIAAVGAGGEEELGPYSGAVYLFARDEGGPDNWGQIRKITASDGEPSNWFGLGLDLEGDRLIVAAASDNDLGSASGSVYLFYRDHGGPDNWGEVKKIHAGDGDGGDYFGFSVSISGDTAVVGAIDDEDNGYRSGSAYIFYRDQGGLDQWGEVRKILPHDGTAQARFGCSVSISGDRVVVGADSHPEPFDYCGSAYLFVRDEGGTDHWGEVQQFSPHDRREWQELGAWVAVEGGNICVGAHGDSETGYAGGAAFFFNQPPGPHLGVSSEKVDFFRTVRRFSAPVSVTVFSVGDQALTVNAITVPPGDFVLSHLPALPAHLEPGQSLTFDVRYEPTEIGGSNAAVTLESDDLNDPSWKVVLRGTALNGARPGVCYASTGIQDTGRIITVDLETGAAALLSDVSNSNNLPGLAIDSTGLIVAYDYDNNAMLGVDGITGQTVKIQSVHSYRSFSTIAFDANDVLHAIYPEDDWGPFYDELVTFDLQTGKVVSLCLTQAEGYGLAGMAFDPLNGALYVSVKNEADDPDAIYWMDRETGDLALLGETGLGGGTPDLALNYLGKLYGVKGSGIDSLSTLIAINKNNGTGVVVGDIGFASVSGLDIDRSSLQADHKYISASAGEPVNFSLYAGAENGLRMYLILGTMRGFTPGLPLPGGQAILPINWDTFTDFVLARLNTGLFSNFLGTLDGEGFGSAQLHFGVLDPKHIGKVMQYAYLLDGNPSFDFASNGISVEVID